MEHKAIEFIGANIQVYNHFESYSIPYEDGHSIDSESSVTKDEFLRLVYEYFTNQTRCNYAYGDDLKDQNATKRFIRNRVNDKSYEIGLDWLNRQTFRS